MANPSDGGTGAERRVATRVELEVEVSLESEHNFYTGLTSDLSQGGVFVATAQPPRVGTVLALKLMLPGATEPFTLQGEVRWVRELKLGADEALPSGCGIQFRELPQAAKKHIERFVAKRDTIFFDED